MRDTLILTLVLGIASLASAALTLNGPVNPAGSDFQLVVSGLGSDVPQVESGAIVGGVYGDLIATAGTDTAASGNLGGTNFIASFGGWDFVVGDLAVGGVADGDWIIYDFTGAAPGIYNFDLFDYAVSSFTPVQSLSVVVPEPATMALLTLGGLLIRRKK